MRLTTSVLALVAALTLAACQSEEEQAREILADALQDYAVMQDRTNPTEARLTAGHSVADALARIVAEFGTTDLGLEIAAGGTVGQITTEDLRRQISALEDLRAFERCDEEPTPACVVDRLVADLGYKDRAELFDRVEPDSTLMMAMALGDTQTGIEAHNRVRDQGLKAFLLAMAPEASLDPRLVTAMFDDLRTDGQDMAATMAAYRIVSGDDQEILRDIAGRSRRGQFLLQVFDKEATFSERMEEFNAPSNREALNWSAMRGAGRMLNAFGLIESDELWPDFAKLKHSMDQIATGMADEWGDDLDYFEDVFGAEAATMLAKHVIADPEADARVLSLALMSAAKLMSEADLQQAVADLEGREVMTWDNIRVFDPLISVSFFGDRALFESVRDTLTPPTIWDDLEGTWETGTQLAAGTVSEAALQDESIFRSAVRVGSMRATPDQMLAFLGDAASKAADVAENFDRPTSRVDVISAARDCGMPMILQQIGATSDDFQTFVESCDAERLGKGIADFTDEEFGIYLGYAEDILDTERLAPLVASVSTAPARGFAMLGSLSDTDTRIFASAAFAMLLAQR
ncbi:hypothetical protein [Yoonia sp.]|uniref:hypothetical protein n=1 Tax=Yoonia sp. TaxID=2212373 RepID=UPI002FDA2380